MSARMNIKACARPFALIVTMVCAATSVAAQANPYPSMAPIAAYQMERAAEIALARSAAPASISRDASVLVLGPRGYETATSGTNGFVCWVARSWMAAFDWPEFWNPKVRAAECMNPQAARSLVPIITLRSGMVVAGRTKADMLSAIKSAYATGRVPKLAPGAMDYMMSKSAYLTDQGEHNSPHVMFFSTDIAAKDWGADAADVPVMAAPYWFFSPSDASQTKGLPPVLVFLMGVATWSDGTAAGGTASDVAEAGRTFVFLSRRLPKRPTSPHHLRSPQPYEHGRAQDPPHDRVRSEVSRCDHAS